METDKIKIQYYKLAQKYHPDKNADSEVASEKFKEISSAWDVISDENQRKLYDASRQEKQEP